MIRTWVELWIDNDDYFDLLTTQLETFEKFTRRDNSLTPKLKSAFLEFILLSKKLTKNYWEKEAIEKLRLEIANASNLVFKSWLLEKTNLGKKEPS